MYYDIIEQLSAKYDFVSRDTLINILDNNTYNKISSTALKYKKLETEFIINEIITDIIPPHLKQQFINDSKLADDEYFMYNGVIFLSSKNDTIMLLMISNYSKIYKIDILINTQKFIYKDYTFNNLEYKLHNEFNVDNIFKMYTWQLYCDKIKVLSGGNIFYYTKFTEYINRFTCYHSNINYDINVEMKFKYLLELIELCKKREHKKKVTFDIDKDTQIKQYEEAIEHLQNENKKLIDEIIKLRQINFDRIQEDDKKQMISKVSTIINKTKQNNNMLDDLF